MLSSTTRRRSPRTRGEIGPRSRRSWLSGRRTTGAKILLEHPSLPKGRALQRSVPGEGKMNVIKVRTRSGKRPPTLGRPILTPDVPVEDDVHDAEAAGVVTRLTIWTIGRQPGQQLTSGRQLRRVVGVDPPVPGAPVVVFAGRTGRAGPGSAPVGPTREALKNQFPKSLHSPTLHRITRGLGHVGSVGLDLRGRPSRAP